MTDDNGPTRQSDIRSTTDPIPEEWESNIAPQGYEPEMVDDIADMEPPARQRRSAIRWGIATVLLIFATFFFCIPRNAERPNDEPAPFNLDQRPRPPADVFLKDLPPQTVGDFNLVLSRENQFFERPYVGARGMVTVYRDANGESVQVLLIDARSDINARRFLRGLKELLQQDDQAEIRDRIWLDYSFVEWFAPTQGEQPYGLAWNNRNYYILVSAASLEALEGVAAAYPY
ncbi:MAG: hypothetical protein ACE5H9_15400 [Anaerolineae bacterium]